MAADTTSDPPVKLWLGNRAAIEEIGGERRKINVSKACTYVTLQPEGLLEQAVHVRALWQHVSDAPGPAWVASTSQQLAELISQAYGGIEIRQPENPDEMHGPYTVDEPRNGE